MSALHFETDQVRHFVLSCVMWDKKKPKRISAILWQKDFLHGELSYIFFSVPWLTCLQVFWTFSYIILFGIDLPARKRLNTVLYSAFYFVLFPTSQSLPPEKWQHSSPLPLKKKGKWLYSRCPHGKLNISWNYHLFKVRISPPPTENIHIVDFACVFKIPVMFMVDYLW